MAKKKMHLVQAAVLSAAFVTGLALSSLSSEVEAKQSPTKKVMVDEDGYLIATISPGALGNLLRQMSTANSAGTRLADNTGGLLKLDPSKTFSLYDEEDDFEDSVATPAAPTGSLRIRLAVADAVTVDQASVEAQAFAEMNANTAAKASSTCSVNASVGGFGISSFFNRLGGCFIQFDTDAKGSPEQCQNRLESEGLSSLGSWFPSRFSCSGF